MCRIGSCCYTARLGSRPYETFSLAQTLPASGRKSTDTVQFTNRGALLTRVALYPASRAPKESRMISGAIGF